ncbi:large tegument protein [Bifidobacterium pseudolongum subsp. globosum]|uniref:Large tegument protein n=1 Tax=Bifidobacterium pseudolongum PV8-2 TaxID=1447715 RepID=A0A0A7I6Q4_9BIFI|nr:hypothetical protein [Bifidobacterium pseudolongum]AIZ15923.1 hypothetical protein AH67_02435 [Bifidobacterium pseudolongum PV8-2]RYQ04834.1 large tegument protein [Bifidobacterium pseudolongum subsp. globosum]RYQ10024.1 large tegument protein [Bifidobacterium pseudolongum subsp. globosum]RYQ14637.1 large tegument protein [Bifidobacterium pseudolongum subsp. globosum]RYQ16498.1 large tegument protein [Bifidobacterium pseudolongum subsp. globosum]
MNPNETQGPGQPQHNETPYAAPAYTQPQQQAAPQAPHVPPQQHAPQQTAAAARKGANLAESLGSQHIQIGGKKIDYAAIVTLVGAVISIIALFLSFTSVSMFGEKVSSSLFQQGAVGWYMLVMLLAIGACAVLEKRFTALVLTGLDTLLVIFVIAAGAQQMQQGSVLSGVLEGYMGQQAMRVQYGAGMWLAIIGVIVMLVGTIVAYYNQVQAHKRTTPATPAAPAGPDPFQNNGWQFGVPAPQQPSSTDTSNWQFGAPNPPAPAAPAAPSAQPFVQPVQAPTMPPAPSAAAAPAATPAPNPNQPNV